MLPEKEYFIFSKKVSKLLKTCFLRTRHPDDPAFLSRTEFGLDMSEVYLFSGQSSLTQNNMYYLNQAEAEKHKDALLAICASLPKLKTVVSGTAGTIAYADLLPDRKIHPAVLKEYCEDADKFIGLLTINDIGISMDFVGSDDFKAAPIVLSYRYKEQVNPDMK